MVDYKYGDIITSDLLVGEWMVEEVHLTRPMVHVFRSAPMGLAIDAMIPIENVLTHTPAHGTMD